jgi:hypothetical protein
MNVRPTSIPDVTIVEPSVYGDKRGFFFESFNQRKLERSLQRGLHFVQDNHSLSTRGVLRGLHYQLPNPQGKLVRVVRGEVFDVAVDLRRGSPTFGRWVGELLSAENKRRGGPVAPRAGRLRLHEALLADRRRAPGLRVRQERGLAQVRPDVLGGGRA